MYRENAKLPGDYIGIFVTSQGMAGIFSNLFRSATIEIWPDKEFLSCYVNYAVGIIASLMCIPAQMHLNKNQYALYYQEDDGQLRASITQMPPVKNKYQEVNKTDESLSVGTR